MRREKPKTRTFKSAQSAVLLSWCKSFGKSRVGYPHFARIIRIAEVHDDTTLVFTIAFTPVALD